MIEPARKPPFSYSGVWEDAARMLAANFGWLSALAGVFLFLPALLIAQFVPPPEPVGGALQRIVSFGDYVSAAWPWLILSTVANMVGIISIYLLLVAPGRLTVAGALSRSLVILPFFWVVTVILNMGFALGFLMLLVGIIFMLGKLVLASPILVAEMPNAPISAVQQSWERTDGISWKVGGLVAIYYVAASFVTFALQVGIGTFVLALLGREGVGALMLNIVVTLVGAAVTMIATVLIAAIYRAVPPRVLRAPGPGPGPGPA